MMDPMMMHSRIIELEKEVAQLQTDIDGIMEGVHGLCQENTDLNQLLLDVYNLIEPHIQTILGSDNVGESNKKAYETGGE